MKVVTFLLDLLYPPRCAFCHDFIETSGDGLCAHCRTGLPFAQNGGRQHFPFIPACVSPLNYEGNVRESLLRYKFGGATGYAKVYGRLVAGTVRAELAGEYDLVTWVPLSRRRLRERGYDQARLLAKATAKELGLPLTPTLHKQRNTQPQSRTGDAAKRRANITGAYRMKRGADVTGKRVLLIDADSQANLTEMLGWQQPDELSPTLATMLERIISDRPIEPQNGILHHKEGMDLLPANIELSGLEVPLVNTMSRETVLRTYLNEVKRQYDYILVDCSPSLGMLTLNALTAADRVIIPVQSHYLPVKGLEQLLRTVSKVQRQLNSNLKISGILITMVDNRTNFAKEISQLVRDTYGKAIRVYDTEIPRGIKAAEMSAVGASIFSFEPQSAVAKAYEQFTKEVLEHEKCREKHSARQL